MEYKNLVLIGTSHIARQSIAEVKYAIENYNPSVVALELDAKRLPALLQKEKRGISWRDIRRVGVKGFLFALLGQWAEQKLGEIVKVSPGSEMKTAYKLAMQKNIKVALIDQDIEVTLKNLSKRMSWKEKWNFIVDILKAVILRKKEVEFDLTKVPEKKVIDKMIGEVKKRYPNIHKVLIGDRNKIMARRLYRIMGKEEGKIVAIVGAGHEEEIIGLIKGLEKRKADIF